MNQNFQINFVCQCLRNVVVLKNFTKIRQIYMYIPYRFNLTTLGH